MGEGVPIDRQSTCPTIRFQEFTVTGSTRNAKCAFARAVTYTRWLTPATDVAATIQFDDAGMTATPATLIQVK